MLQPRGGGCGHAPSELHAIRNTCVVGNDLDAVGTLVKDIWGSETFRET